MVTRGFMPWDRHGVLLLHGEGALKVNINR